MSLTTSSAAPRLWRVALVALFVLTATAFGARHVVSVLKGPADPMTLQVNGISYRVLHVEQVSGLSDADLGGMSHGVNSLVTTDRALVRVTLEVAASDADAGYDTSVLRALAGTVPLDPVAGSMKRGSLRRGGHLEGALSYVVPRNGAQLRLTAPGQVAVPLLRVDTAGPAATHDHGRSGPPSNAPPVTSTTVPKQVSP
ncbi:hypothetical protein ASD62_17860 [Phycicoccus sp. Root563]|uniref:hypothetical protein n=1 Tax=Phycicoccus sp. Root563 TaxID=1736562 RepID=UPI000702486D|nr:hypothetical protein [Phycicoccus sp. Root563]KQZ87449.1 hypothetical protein ASD62_17860 [Phycicoccus sp. Root563]